MTLELLPPLFSIYKLKSSPSAENLSAEFCFFSKTEHEFSLVCPADCVVDNALSREDDWRAFRIEGQHDLSLAGIPSRLSAVLAKAAVGIYAISTFDTDYILIKEKQLYPAYLALTKCGFEIRGLEAFIHCVDVVNHFLSDISTKVGSRIQTAYITGSTVFDDFHPGFSDLDFFFIASRPLTNADFSELHQLYNDYRKLSDGWFSALEGEIVSPTSLETGVGPTIYWGTSRDRFANRYTLSGFSMRTFLERGILLTGSDQRKQIPFPSDTCIIEQSRHLFDTVRKYAIAPDGSPHYADWIFLLSQTLYTLTTGKQTSKTRAARWLKASLNNPVLVFALELAERIRFHPESADEESLSALKNPIQALADLLIPFW